MKVAWLLVLVPHTAEADCALVGLAPKVLTRADAVLAPDGGIVVGAVSQDRGPLDSGDIAVQPAWRFVVPMGTIRARPQVGVHETDGDPVTPHSAVRNQPRPACGINDGIFVVETALFR